MDRTPIRPDFRAVFAILDRLADAVAFATLIRLLESGAPKPDADTVMARARDIVEEEFMKAAEAHPETTADGKDAVCASRMAAAVYRRAADIVEGKA